PGDPNPCPIKTTGLNRAVRTCPRRRTGSGPPYARHDPPRTAVEELARMPIKKSELYSSLWSSCDELRGGMDASQYKDYVLVLLFIKYVSDKYAGVPYAPITILPGASFKDTQGHPRSVTPNDWHSPFPYNRLGSSSVPNPA